jgi:serine/threonine protein phosphatase PrpC
VPARSFHLTHPGRRREHNEDALSCDDALGLYVVCDGVGGHAKGEVASRETADQVIGYVRANLSTIDEYRAAPSPNLAHGVRRVLESAAQSACYMVYGLAELDPSQRGMATTMSALLLIGQSAFVAQVGDSRVYLVRSGRARQLTEDHTLVNAKLKKGLISAEQAQTMKGKNVITRAVGHKDYVEVDLYDFPLMPGDRFLLCSDGLHGYLEDGELERVLLDGDEAQAPARFVELANSRGGKDNISVVLVTT